MAPRQLRVLFERASRGHPEETEVSAVVLDDRWNAGKASANAAPAGPGGPVVGKGIEYLDVNYTTDGASYRLASRTPLVEVLPGQNGKFAVKVTNTGSSTWTPSNGYELSYEAYNSSRRLVANHPVFTPMPSTVAPGQTVTVDAAVNALGAGAYAINFDMYSGATGSSPVSFVSQGILPYAMGLDIPQPPPTVSAVYPPTGYVSPTLRQQLAVAASTATGTITYNFTLTCKPGNGQTCSVTTLTSPSLTQPHWTPPAASLQWNTPYQWSVKTTVNGASTTISGLNIEYEVPQPGLTAGLGGTSGQAYDPLSGNYTTSATDAAVATAGMPLEITRTYNSMDPRTSGAFGAGWSSVIDAALRPDGDSTGNTSETTGDVLVTLPDGKQLRFGENGNGSYAAPMGSLDTLKHSSDGTWTVRDSSGDQFTFTSGGLITDSTDETIGLWFKGASSTASGVLFSYEAQAPAKASGNHTPVLYVGGNGELYGEFWNGSVDPIHTTTSVDDGKWHYVVLTAASTTQSMYLDGKQVGSAVSGQINNLNETVDSIGAGYWSSWPENTKGGTTTTVGYFNGDIGQVAVYPHPLGPSAVAAQYASGAAASPEMTQVTLPSGNAYEITGYDETTDRVASYTDPNNGTWTIGQPSTTGYRPTADSLADVVDHVTVTDPVGKQDTYAYDMLNGGRLISFDNGIDPPKLYGYDANGFLASVADQDGNVACMTNDAHGNELTRTWYGTEPAVLPGGIIGTVTGCVGSTSSSPMCASLDAPCTTFYGYPTYDSSNPLDPKNNELTSVRDGRSASATDNTYLTSYAYSGGQLTSETTPPTTDFPNGRTTSYTYSAGTESAYPGPGTIPPGLLLTKTTPGGAKTTYQYDSAGDLTKLTEPSGRYTVNTYDALGRVLTATVFTSTFSCGETTSFTHDALNRQATVTHPGVLNALTNVTHTLQDAYSYDVDGNLLTSTESDLTGNDPSRTTTYTYNDHDQVVTVTQPAGATIGGSQTEGASSADPQGATTGYDYDAFGNISTRIDPNGNEYRYTYNEYNQPAQVDLYTPSTSQSTPTANCTAPATQVADGGCDLVIDSNAYDPAGLLASTTDAMGRITNYTYYFNQDLLSATTTDGSTSPTTGRQTMYGYDGAGNMISKSVSAMSGGGSTTTTTTNYTYDAADRLGSVVDDAGSGSGYANRTVSYTYNADNYILSQTVGASGQGGPSVTDYAYDTAGDRTSQTVVDGSTNLTTTWTYDQNGLPTSMTTPAGNVSGATAANYTTTYAYDPVGNLITVTGAPVQVQTYTAQTPATTTPVTKYGYDTFADRTQTEDPDTNVTVTGYDGDGGSPRSPNRTTRRPAARRRSRNRPPTPTTRTATSPRSPTRPAMPPSTVTTRSVTSPRSPSHS